jgi:hypothetical protein
MCALGTMGDRKYDEAPSWRRGVRYNALATERAPIGVSWLEKDEYPCWK